MNKIAAAVLSTMMFGATMFAGLWVLFFFTFGMCFGNPQRCSGATDPSRPMNFILLLFAVIGFNLAALIYLETTKKTAGNVRRRLLISAVILAVGFIAAIAVNPVMVRLAIRERQQKFDTIGYQILVRPDFQNNYNYVIDYDRWSRGNTSEYTSSGYIDGGYLSIAGMKKTTDTWARYGIFACQEMYSSRLSNSETYVSVQCQQPNSLQTKTLETRTQSGELRYDTYYTTGNTLMEITGTDFADVAAFDRALKQYVDSLAPISRSEIRQMLYSNI